MNIVIREKYEDFIGQTIGFPSININKSYTMTNDYSSEFNKFPMYFCFTYYTNSPTIAIRLHGFQMLTHTIFEISTDNLSFYTNGLNVEQPTTNTIKYLHSNYVLSNIITDDMTMILKINENEHIIPISTIQEKKMATGISIPNNVIPSDVPYFSANIFGKIVYFPCDFDEESRTSTIRTMDIDVVGYRLMNTYDWLDLDGFSLSSFNNIMVNTFNYNICINYDIEPFTLLQGIIPLIFSITSTGSVSILQSTNINTSTDTGENTAISNTVISNYVDKIFISLFQQTSMNVNVTPINIGSLINLQYDPQMSMDLQFDQTQIMDLYSSIYGYIKLSDPKLYLKIDPSTGFSLLKNNETVEDWQLVFDDITFEGGSELIILNNKIPTKSIVSINNVDTLQNNYSIKIKNVTAIAANKPLIQYKFECTLIAQLINNRKVIKKKVLTTQSSKSSSNIFGIMRNENKNIDAVSNVSSYVSIRLSSSSVSLLVILSVLLLLVVGVSVYFITKYIKKNIKHTQKKDNINHHNRARKKRWHSITY